MKILNAKKERAITLVVLVITIVVLLILASVSISSLTNTGIFEKAKKAKEVTENAEKKQNTILREYEKEMDQYGNNTLVSNFNNGKIKIGDYISYEPEEIDNSKLDILKENLKKYSGKSDSTVNSSIQRNNLNWRVLDVKDGHVRLISETPTTSNIELKGYDGCNNVVKLLDDACYTLYNNSKIAYSVQNLKLEDIIDKLNTKVERAAGANTLKSAYYPNIYEKEYEQIVIKDDSTIVGNKIKQNEQKEFINGKTKAKEVRFRNSYWDKVLNNSSFKDKIYYELFINDGTNDYPEYSLSTRVLFITNNEKSQDACYGVRYVKRGYYTRGMMWSSSEWNESASYKFRPVITLNSNTQIDYSSSGDGSAPDKAYVIK